VLHCIRQARKKKKKGKLKHETVLELGIHCYFTSGMLSNTGFHPCETSSFFWDKSSPLFSWTRDNILVTENPSFCSIFCSSCLLITSLILTTLLLFSTSSTSGSANLTFLLLFGDGGGRATRWYNCPLTNFLCGSRYRTTVRDSDTACPEKCSRTSSTLMGVLYSRIFPSAFMIFTTLSCSAKQFPMAFV